MNPRIEVDLTKLTENVSIAVRQCAAYNIHVMGVTKCFCGNPEIARAMVDGGARMLGDSRLHNLAKLGEFNLAKVLLRIPMISEAEQVVELADYSLNSELETLRALGKAALRRGCIHQAILMLDLGDLREGIWKSDMQEFVLKASEIEGISIKGFGTNLSCYGGVIPEEENLQQLVNISREMETKFGLSLEFISGGNSSSYYLLEKGTIPEGINQLRLGELLLLGRETAFGDYLPEFHQDVFQLKGELVEVKWKPSVPEGRIGMDAFGNVPVYEDRGMMKRGIVALGRQDINPEGLMPVESTIEVLGGSSDHTILDLTQSEQDYRVGDTVAFQVDYGCLLKAMTSPYVDKVMIL